MPVINALNAIRQEENRWHNIGLPKRLVGKDEFK